MAVDEELKSGYNVADLARLVVRGEGDLKTFPKVFINVCEKGDWRKRRDPNTKRRYVFEDFAQFIHDDPPAGLGTTRKQLQGLCGENVEARDMLDKMLQRPASLHAVSNRNGTGRPVGTTESQALRKLRKDRPDLHAKVLDGEMSAHAAAIEAGFRKRTRSVPVDSAESAVRALARWFESKEIKDAARRL